MLENSQIEVYYAAGEKPYARLTLDVLGQAVLALSEVFQLTGAFPKVRVVLVKHRDAFDRLVRDLLQVEIENPSYPARIAQAQRTDMVVISPSAYAAHTPFTYDPDSFGRLLVHELVHMFEEHLSPNIEASPRWWGEGLAVYFSDQWRFDDLFRKAALDSIAQNQIPGLDEIEEDAGLAYDWGWTVVCFLVKVYGTAKILQIVRGCPDGDVLAWVDKPFAEIEDVWRRWLMRAARF